MKCLLSVYEVPSDPALFLTNSCKIQTLNSFGQATSPGRLQAIALLLNYIKHTQTQALTNIYKISYHAQLGMVLMDDITMKNLELFSSSYEASEKYSLIGILDQTTTSGGARYLRYLLSNPIHTLPLLQERQNHIARYQTHPHTKQFLKELNATFDIHKLLSTILYRKLTPIPFIKLRTTLGIFFDTASTIKQELLKLGMSQQEEDQLSQLRKLLQQALKSNEEIKLEMDYIADTYHPEIDKLRTIAYHSDELLMEYQQFLVRETKVNNVKLKFVMNQGYFIEVTQKDMPTFETKINATLTNQEPERPNGASSTTEGIALRTREPSTTEGIALREKLTLQRRQTLKDNQRYSSPYLEEIQQAMLSAKEQLAKKELEILTTLAQQISNLAPILSSLAQKIAELDVYCSHALFALEHRYIQPELNATNTFHIQGGRHPVIEAYLPKDQQFIANDLSLGNQKAPSGATEQDHGLIHIIT